MNPIYGYLYTRPGNICQTFDILRKTVTNQQGYPVESYERTGKHVTGILSASDSQTVERTKHLWDQDQHSLTHVLSMRGRPDVRKGDRLIGGERAFLVLTGDTLGMVGGSSLLYLEERNDLK